MSAVVTVVTRWAVVTMVIRVEGRVYVIFLLKVSSVVLTEQLWFSPQEHTEGPSLISQPTVN